MSDIIPLKSRFKIKQRVYPMVVIPGPIDDYTDASADPTSLRIGKSLLDHDLKFFKIVRPFQYYNSRNKDFQTMGVTSQLGMLTHVNTRNESGGLIYGASRYCFDDQDEHLLYAKNINHLLTNLLGQYDQLAIVPSIFLVAYLYAEDRIGKEDAAHAYTELSRKASDLLLEGGFDIKDYDIVDYGLLINSHHFGRILGRRGMDDPRDVLRALYHLGVGVPRIEYDRHLCRRPILTGYPDTGRYHTFLEYDSYIPEHEEDLPKDASYMSGGEITEKFYETLLSFSDRSVIYQIDFRSVFFTNGRLTFVRSDIKLAQSYSPVRMMSAFDAFDHASTDLSGVNEALVEQACILLRQSGVTDSQVDKLTITLIQTFEEECLLTVTINDELEYSWHYDLKLYKLIAPAMSDETYSSAAM